MRCLDGRLPPRPLATLALVALLAGCQPLPHPFADDRPPAELLRVPESASVSIAPIEGEPRLIAADLGSATARALVKREIPASEKTALRGSYQLYGGITASRLSGAQSAIRVEWRLKDARGREIGEREVSIEGTADDWQAAGTAMIERLAGLSADAVAPLIVKEPAVPKLAAATRPITGMTEPDAASPEPPSAKPPVPELPLEKPAAIAPPTAGNPARKQDSERIRVALRRITGAPGDGATSLANAITAVLRQQDLTIIDTGGKADFYIDAEVSLAPAGSDKQHVKIVWVVHSASGAELGTVGQENDVPRGQLSGPWGDVAYVVATAAGDGLLQVLAHAAPPANPAAGDGKKSARESPSAGAVPPATRTTPDPAAASEKAAKGKGQR